MPSVVSIGDVPSSQADAMLFAVCLACYADEVPKELRSPMLNAYQRLEYAVLGVTPDAQQYMFSEDLPRHA